MAKIDIKGIWPSMLKFLKGFPKNLKPMIKDPVTNMKELEERRKDVWGLLYTFISLTIIFVILTLIPGVGDIFSMLMIIPVVGLMLGIFLVFILGKIESKFKALTCDACGYMQNVYTDEEYAKLVSYEIVNQTYDAGVSHPSSNNGVVSEITATGKSSAQIKVTFRCPKCGESKSFLYNIEPFKCENKQSKVLVRDVELVKMNLLNPVKEVMEVYKNGNRAEIPFSITSIHSPDYENRTKLQTGNSRPRYNGVTIVYNRTIDELVEGIFVRNELNGSIKSL